MDQIVEYARIKWIRRRSRGGVRSGRRRSGGRADGARCGLRLSSFADFNMRNVFVPPVGT